MAASSLTVDEVYRHMSYIQVQFSKTMQALQGLLFISSEMFELLYDMDETFPQLKRWSDFVSELQKDD